MARSRVKKWFGFIHLWIGLTTGIIIFLVSITGSIYVFRDELFNLAHHHVLYNNTTTKQPALPITKLWDAAQKHIGAPYKLEAGTAFSEPDRNWEFTTSNYNDSAITYFGWVLYDYTIYINPYTAKVEGVLDNKYEFFQLVKMLHWSLLLHTYYGQPIVGAAILLFIVSLISGLVIWWPKKTKQLKENMKVRWKARWRRINYDIHRSAVIYILPFIFIISLTGLVWAFKWIQAIVYVAATQSITPPERPSIQSVYDNTYSWPSEKELLNHIVASSFMHYPNAYSVHFHPADRQDTTQSMSVYIRHNGVVYYNAALQYYDQYSGKMISAVTFDKLNRGEKLIYMNYDIHVGQILGTSGKILAFVVSLICASLPITGFMIWWGRRKINMRKEANLKKSDH